MTNIRKINKLKVKHSLTIRKLSILLHQARFSFLEAPIINTPYHMKVIAIAGLPGSGKTEVINYLTRKYNWPKVYFGDIIINGVKNENLKVTEKNERMIREKLRAKYGMAVCAIKSMSTIKKLLKTSEVVLIESMYSWEEYLELKKKFKENFLVIAVYAPPQIRYARLKNRKERPLVEKEAIGRDYAQIENSHQAGPIAMADYTILNIGSAKELYKGIEFILKQINKAH